MSFSSEYAALRKKRKKNEEEETSSGIVRLPYKGGATVEKLPTYKGDREVVPLSNSKEKENKPSSKKSSFAEQYAELRSKRSSSAVEDDDILPVREKGWRLFEKEGGGIGSTIALREVAPVTEDRATIARTTALRDFDEQNAIMKSRFKTRLDERMANDPAYQIEQIREKNKGKTQEQIKAEEKFGSIVAENEAKKAEEEGKKAFGSMIENAKNKTDVQRELENVMLKGDQKIAEQKEAEKARPKGFEKKKKWFQAEAFEDGYDFGDITKSLGATVGDVLVNAGQGLGSMGEGVVDLFAYMSAYNAVRKGRKDTAEMLREWAQKDVVGDFVAPAKDYLDGASFLGDKSDSVSQGLGQIAGIYLTAGLGGAAGLGSAGATALTTGTMFASSAGSGMGEAYASGASDKQAMAYGALKGIADAGSELIFGGLGKGINALGVSRGLSSLDDMFAKKLSDGISNQVVKNFVEFGVKSSAEGFEEVLAGLGTAAAQKLTYMSDAELSQLIEDQELFDQFIIGTVTSALAQSGYIPGPADGSLKESNATGRDFITGYTQSEQSVIDRVFEDRISEMEEAGEELSEKDKKKLLEEVQSDLERGYISTDVIDEVIGGDSYKAWRDADTKENEILEEYNRLADTPSEKLSLNEQKRRDELDSRIEELRQKSESSRLRAELDNKLTAQLKGSRLDTSYIERGRKREAFTADLSHYENEAAKKSIQNLIDVAYANNTGAVHDFADAVAKLAEASGKVFSFVNNEQIREMGKAVEGATVNGFITSDGVAVNLDSPKAWEFIVGHEVTHAFEQAKSYSELHDALKAYAQSKGEWDSRFEELTTLYEGQNADIDAELTADLVGEYLFNDAEFVSNLSTNHRNVFQRIYDSLKHLLKMTTVGSKQARQLERAKYAFEKAMREGGTASVEGTKHSLSADNEGRQLTEGQREYFKDSKMRDENGALKVMYHGSQNAGFHTFDARFSDDDTSFFFVDRNDVAASYSGTTETYEARTIRTAEDMNSFLAEIGYDEDYEVVERDGQYVLLYEGDRVAASDTAQGAYEEFCWYEGVGEGDVNYKVYLNLKNPLEVDAKGRPWNDLRTWQKAAHIKSEHTEVRRVDGEFRLFDKITGEELPNTTIAVNGYTESMGRDVLRSIMVDKANSVLDITTENLRSTRDVAKWAKEHGYDGVIFKNIIDNGGYSNGSEGASTVAVAFDSAQIKSVANEMPTSDPDIRYSLSKDSEGRELSEGQKEYFNGSKVVDANGALKIVYHGSGTEFTEFSYDFMSSHGSSEGQGFYFTDSEQYAKGYQKNGVNLMKGYLNIKKPLSDSEVTIKRNELSKLLKAVDPTGDDVIINYDPTGGMGYPSKAWYNRALAGTVDSMLQYNSSDSEILADIANSGAGTQAVLEQVRSLLGYDGYIVEGKYDDAVIYVAFESNQFKNVDNVNPTDDPDIRRSLSYEGEADANADMRLHPLEDVLPVREDANVHESAKDARNIAEDDFAPIPEDVANAQSGENLASLTDEDAPPEVVAPYYGDEAEDIDPADPFAERDIKEVGKRSVKAYMYENPEVKPFFQSEANVMLGELERTIKGERIYTDTEYMNEYGYTSQGVWQGTKRQTSDDIAYLLDECKYTYDEIEAGLKAIIEDHGAENNACSKRIEFILNDRLRLGYTDFMYGDEIPANEEYKRLLEEKQITEYNAEAFRRYFDAMGDDIVPVAETPAETRIDLKYLMAEDDALPVRDDVQAEAEGVTTPAEEAVPTPEAAADDAQITTMKEKLTAKKGNFEAELKANRENRAKSRSEYDEKITALQTEYNGLKKKDTKRANNLLRRIARLERMQANVDADYAKHISDIEKRIGRTDAELQKDHTRADNLERAYARIDRDLEAKKTALAESFAQKRAELTRQIGNRNAFISSEAGKLYDELSNLRRGVRASKDLGYLLDLGYDWKSLKAALAHARAFPGRVVNTTSEVEAVVRESLLESYKARSEELADLENELSRAEAQLDMEAEIERDSARKAEDILRRSELHENYVNEMKAEFSAQGYDLDTVLRRAKNLSTFATVDNTPQRVMKKSLGYKEGDILADITVNRVAQNETEAIKWLNSFTDRKNGVIAKLSKKYNIKPGSRKSMAAQMYAEGYYVNEQGEYITYGDHELAADFPNVKVQENIKGLARDPIIRRIYDETLDAINDSRVRNAYPEIQRLNNYFLHFQAMDDAFSRLGIPFNPNDIKAKDLPTDINGMTADLKPGQPYFASARHRLGIRTTFDLLGGLEKYLTSAKNQIYHIDDIQRLRALRNYIADDYGQAKGLESLDALTEEEAEEKIKQVFGAHLSTFAKFLNEEANVLAGKTALIDRGLEGIIGRRGLTFIGDINKQVGANQVGFNLGSSLTNFLAPVQAFAKTNKFDFLKGFTQTVANRLGSIIGKGDNFANDSSVMIRRKGAERFHRTAWQKMSDPGYALMGAVDSISTEIIARAKYNELTRKGMTPEQAHLETDKWVSALMGDRSLGQMPQIYNSRMLGLITKYQLEVRNQLDSMVYDTIQETKVSNEEIDSKLRRNAKTAAKVAATWFELAVAQNLFGKAFEAIAGYNPAFDIIEAISAAMGWDDDDDSEDTVLDNIEEGFLTLLEDLPYSSLILDGGRIPISGALPIGQLVTGENDYGQEVSRLDTVKEALPYYVMPAGYGQLKKTVAGLKMFDSDLPVSGSYTDKGALRFPVEKTPLNVAQAALFGQWASENARDYFDNERKPLEEKQINEYIDSEMTIQEYWNYRAGLSGLKTLEEKADYINSLDIPLWKKNLFINNIADRKEDINMEDYGEYGSLEEFDFANEYPEKYAFFKDNGISYDDYDAADKATKSAYNWAAKDEDRYAFLEGEGISLEDPSAFDSEEEKNAYTWAYKNPEKYAVAKAVSGDVVTYKKYTGELYDIKADKDENGDSIRGSRKEKVLDYINGLDADYGEKIILFKNEYNADDTYNYDIIDYLNSRDDISYSEMETILKELGFDVDSEGNVSW